VVADITNETCEFVTEKITQNSSIVETDATEQDTAHAQNTQPAQPFVEQPNQDLQKLLPLLQTLFEIGLILVGLYANYKFLLHYVLGINAQIRFAQISALLEHGTMPNMKYSIVGPAFSIPFWLVGKLYQSSIWWCERYNLILFAFGLLFLYLLLHKYVERRLLHTFLLLLVVASMFGNHITNYYSEVFSALCVGIGIIAVTVGPALGGWCAIVLGVVNAPATLLGLCCMVGKRIYDEKRLRYALAIIAVVALIVAESWIRRGSPFSTGYGKELGFSSPFIGLLSVLFSFGKGLIFFAPGLILPVRSTILSWQREKKVEIYQTYLLWICFLVGMILVYSSWWAWYGGWFWGPRFFLFASIPASFALAVRLRHAATSSLGLNLLTALIFLLSVWVGIEGAVFDQKSLQGTCTRSMDACLYQPQLSVLWRPFFATIPITRYDAYFIAFSLFVAGYLVIPLLGTITHQLIAVGKKYGNILLQHNEWHF